MNEQVEYLFDQALEEFKAENKYTTIVVPDPLQRGFVEKFAELIVRECMRMCEVTEMSFVTHDCDVEASGAITVKQFIAEHFGVEE